MVGKIIANKIRQKLKINIIYLYLEISFNAISVVFRLTSALCYVIILNVKIFLSVITHLSIISVEWKRRKCNFGKFDDEYSK